MENKVYKHLELLIERYPVLSACKQSIIEAYEILERSYVNGGKLLVCGNGGSHCDAMHFAEELTGRYRENRPGYPAIAISDVSHLSCVSNDFGYEYVFSRYVEAVGQKGDVCRSSRYAGPGSCRLLGLREEAQFWWYPCSRNRTT